MILDAIDVAMDAGWFVKARRVMASAEHNLTVPGSLHSYFMWAR